MVYIEVFYIIFLYALIFRSLCFPPTRCWLLVCQGPVCRPVPSVRLRPESHQSADQGDQARVSAVRISIDKSQDSGKEAEPVFYLNAGEGRLLSKKTRKPFR